MPKLRLKAKYIVLALILVMISISLIIAESLWHIISNILGPYGIHVAPETVQLLTISATEPPPSNVYLGQTINMTLTVTNPCTPTSGDVQGYVLVNITSTTDFPDSAVYLELKAEEPFGGWIGSTWFSAIPIPQGYAFKSQTRYTWRSCRTESAILYITFNQEGDYQVTIAITSK